MIIALPWWTRWWLGVLRIHSSGPRSSINSVWIQNWYSKLVWPMEKVDVSGGTMVGTWDWRTSTGRGR